MGSSPSVVEVPEGHMVGDGHATRRYQGFQEVEMADPEGQVASTSTPSRNKEQMQRAAAVALQADDPLAGEGADLYSVVGQMQRQKTTLDAEFEQPNYEEEEDLVLETFYHQNGTSFTCVYQGGQRFYLDSWETQDWQPFPKSWYKEGVLVTDKVLKNNDQTEEAPQDAEAKSDDREGVLEHPSRGTLTTYIFEEKRNIHYFFDKDTGAWIRLPIAWELQSELVKQLIEPIQEALPEWKDTHDILAALRSSNYDPHDCIATYLATGSSNEMQTPRNSGDAKAMEQKDQKIKELNKSITKLKQKLEKSTKSFQHEKEERQAAEKLVAKLSEQISEMEVKVSTSIAQVEAIQRERPKTARPKSAAPTPQQVTVGDVTNPETILELNENAKLMHKDHVKLKMEATQKFKEMKAMFKQLAVGITKIDLCDREQGKEVDDLRELYRREALQRKMLYNKLQELRGNIRVFCRCRNDDRVSVCHQFPTDREILPPSAKKPYKFDRVFKPESTQDEVFEDVKPIIASCVDGYNVCLLAYGQTGSGKTFTMNGSKSLPGVNVRSIRELLNLCADKDNVQYSLKASMVEIYNECIQDLLTNQNRQLDIKAKGKSIHLPGMTEMFVENERDIEKILELGDQNRSVAATKMNSTSSRSHLVFMITVEGRDKASGASSVGTLTLCDLAGSERVAKTEAQGQRLVEAAAINKSLTSLGQVFTALRTGQLHIPYRNSKLTHILQPCLGGDAKAALFVTVSPDIDNVAESTSTLTFGSNARQVTLGQAKQNVKRPGPASNADAWGITEA